MLRSKTPSAERTSALQLLDANLNRAREAIRALEDTCRFVRRDAAAARALRACRHALDRLSRGHYSDLLRARQVEQDSGRRNPSEPYAGGAHDILAANCKRAEEALRVIEEYSRWLSPEAAPEAQRLRFEIYRWEKRLNGRRPR